MKLATALLERAELQTKLTGLEKRLISNSKVQEGEEPSEDPQDLLKELDEVINRMEVLITQINNTNNVTIKDGVTVTSLLAKRDCLKLKLRTLKSFADEANRKIDRYSRNEIKVLSTVNVSDLQKTIDKLSKELRVVDETIQEVNWTTELVEI